MRLRLALSFLTALVCLALGAGSASAVKYSNPVNAAITGFDRNGCQMINAIQRRTATTESWEGPIRSWRQVRASVFMRCQNLSLGAPSFMYQWKAGTAVMQEGSGIRLYKGSDGYWTSTFNSMWTQGPITNYESVAMLYFPNVLVLGGSTTTWRG